MSVYRTPGSPFWYYQIRVSGRRFRGSTKETEREAAEAFAHGERTRRELGAQIKDSTSPEVDELLSPYLAKMKDRIAALEHDVRKLQDDLAKKSGERLKRSDYPDLAILCRYFGKDGQLLNVVAKRPEEAVERWYDKEMAELRIEHFPTLEDAEKAAAMAMMFEAPRYVYRGAIDELTRKIRRLETASVEP